MITLNNVMDKIDEQSFREILDNLSCDSDKILNVSKNAILNEMLNDWVTSLKSGKPDFTIYSRESYIVEVFNCWKQYSRKYIRLMDKYLESDSCEIDMGGINIIMDLGCGLGFTTVGLHKLFPNANCVGTNIVNTPQFEFADSVCSGNGCTMIDEMDTLKLDSVDMIVAFEFFEHLQNPIKLLKDIIYTYRPKYFVVANTFTQMSIGHFYLYDCCGKMLDGKSASRFFNNFLRQNGYKKLDTGFFNSRPSIWKLYSTKGGGLIAG